MNLASSIAFVLAAGALGAWAWLAGPDANQPVNAAPSPVETAAATARKAEPSAARLEARSLERWSAVCRGDWIAAYDFQTTEQKLVPLAQYLQGKNHHTYANPAIERVLAVGPTDGFLAVRALWTPTHPELQRVRLEPGQTLTEELHMIESWRWDGADWSYVRAQSTEDFFKEHPELGTR